MAAWLAAHEPPQPPAAPPAEGEEGDAAAEEEAEPPAEAPEAVATAASTAAALAAFRGLTLTRWAALVPGLTRRRVAPPADARRLLAAAALATGVASHGQLGLPATAPTHAEGTGGDSSVAVPPASHWDALRAAVASPAFRDAIAALAPAVAGGTGAAAYPAVTTGAATADAVVPPELSPAGARAMLAGLTDRAPLDAVSTALGPLLTALVAWADACDAAARKAAFDAVEARAAAAAEAERQAAAAAEAAAAAAAAAATAAAEEGNEGAPAEEAGGGEEGDGEEAAAADGEEK